MIMIFILQFVNMIYHIDQFADFELCLHPQNKPCLLIAYDLFNVLLISVC